MLGLALGCEGRGLGKRSRTYVKVRVRVRVRVGSRTSRCAKIICQQSSGRFGSAPAPDTGGKDGGGGSGGGGGDR